MGDAAKSYIPSLQVSLIHVMNMAFTCESVARLGFYSLRQKEAPPPITVTLISRIEVSASMVIAVSPLPLRKEVAPTELRDAAVKAEAARDP